MSVLIKGMEMPRSCVDCRFHKSIYCTLTDICTNTAQGCPLVPVPPHGRLIDADALSKSLDALCDRVCQYSMAQRKVMCSACPLGDAFAVVEDDAPTIIEAEEGE